MKPHKTVKIDIREFGKWAPTVVHVREAILKGWILAASSAMENMLPPDIMALAPDADTIDRICTLSETAVRAGRLVDFGKWDNDTIIYCSQRGGPLYSKDAIGHPFRQPWVFTHEWEGGVSVYLVNPLEPDRATGGDCECVELQPAMTAGMGILMISDRIVLEPQPPDVPARHDKFYCEAIPSVFRFLPGAEAINNGKPPANAAASNVLEGF